MYLLYYYLKTYLLYLNNFIFCNRKIRIQNEKNELKRKKPFKTCFKLTLIKNAFFNNTIYNIYTFIRFDKL